MCTVFARVRFAACECVRLLMYCTYVHPPQCFWLTYTCQWPSRADLEEFQFLVNKRFRKETYGSHRVMVAINTTRTNAERMWVGQWGDISWITWRGAYPAVPAGVIAEDECRFTENKELNWADLMLFKLPQPRFYCFTDTSEAQTSNAWFGLMFGLLSKKAHRIDAAQQPHRGTNRHPNSPDASIKGNVFYGVTAVQKEV